MKRFLKWNSIEEYVLYLCLYVHNVLYIMLILMLFIHYTHFNIYVHI